MLRGRSSPSSLATGSLWKPRINGAAHTQKFLQAHRGRRSLARYRCASRHMKACGTIRACQLQHSKHQHSRRAHSPNTPCAC